MTFRNIPLVVQLLREIGARAGRLPASARPVTGLDRPWPGRRRGGPRHRGSTRKEYVTTLQMGISNDDSAQLVLVMENPISDELVMENSISDELVLN